MGAEGPQRRTLFGTPKRQAVGSNPDGITILPTRFDRFVLKKDDCEAGRIFLFQDTTKRKNLLTEDSPC